MSYPRIEIIVYPNEYGIELPDSISDVISY